MNLVCMGDSVTRGGLWMTKNLPSRLAEKYPTMSVINLAVAGNYVADMLTRVGDADKYKPFQVIVWGGINDIAAGYSAASIEATLGSIYSYYSGAGAKVIAVTISACDTNTLGMISTRDTVNTWIKNLPSGVSRAVDACTLTSDPVSPGVRLAAYVDPLSPNHLNDAGIAAVANLIVG